MNFFAYAPASEIGGEEHWTVPKKFWLYWAIVLPTTGVTTMLWQFWHRIFPSDKLGDRMVDRRDSRPAMQKLWSSGSSNPR
jgi:hypothetical protein